jgi:hypothetical protein
MSTKLQHATETIRTGIQLCLLTRILRVIYPGVLLATILGTVAQTQLNLWELQQLGAPDPRAERLQPHFVICGSFRRRSLLISAGSRLRWSCGAWFSPWRWLPLLAGAVGIVVPRRQLRLPMPTFIAATRHVPLTAGRHGSRRCRVVCCLSVCSLTSRRRGLRAFAENYLRRFEHI